MIRPAATVRIAGPTSPVRAAARIMGQAKYTGAQPAPSARTICWSRTNTGARLDGEGLRGRARARLDGARTPKRILVVPDLPLRGPGKVDRRAVAALLEAV